MIQKERRAFGLSALYTPNLLIKTLDRLLGFSHINDFVERPEIASLETLPFLDHVNDHFGLVSRFDPSLDSIVGKSGAKIIVCNHPTGLAETITLCREILKIRSDLKVVANAMLGSIKPLAPILLLTDVFKDGQQQANAQLLKQALKHLQSDGLLLLFPAGEISHLHSHGIIDGPWSYTPLWLAKMSGASLVCIHADSENHSSFYQLRKINQHISTAFIGKALYAQRGKPVCYKCSSAISFSRLPNLTKNEASEYLRSLTYSMQTSYQPAKAFSIHSENLAISPETALLEQELGRLEPLLQHKQFTLYETKSAPVPNLMLHLGIEREKAF
ncbi:MAG: hypothetical protein JSR46_00225, partial [Verrucomicrobia bacterium]|nr:hypothetical protein [Verrucomicrobiota bacterium]